MAGTAVGASESRWETGVKDYRAGGLSEVAVCWIVRVTLVLMLPLMTAVRFFRIILAGMIHLPIFACADCDFV